ncbi:hypothetical protein SAMN04489806_0860 [Paramicrobacterium humi]|uniref:Uncharacterized protein n=1 Tax=Paramicrobacterium humi TaxID=640635 RepID=A0A1H4JTX4_9MICO|nr:hypothetical protein [Microbacterium humi]SEB49683.1 hypothetical protein SAMN04489806_0860 [Microbacterium humi]
MTKKTSQPKRPASASDKVRAAVGRLGMLEISVFALSCVLGIWSWLAFVVSTPQDYAAFTLIYWIGLIIASTVQMVAMLIVRNRGARDLGDALTSTPPSLPYLLLGPIVVVAVAMLIVTPPGTPTAGFDDDFSSIYQIIGLFVLLALIAVALGAGVVFLIIVLPVLAVAVSMRKGSAASIERFSGGLASRGELVCGALILPAALGFGVGMYFVAPDAGSGLTANRMLVQFLMWVSFQGELLPSVVAWLCLALMIGLVTAYNVQYGRRMRREVTGG